MKKGLLLLAGVAMFATTSCRKNWTCTCVDSDDGYTESFAILLQKKKDAEATCSSYNYNGSTYTTTCNLD
jgi:hypothetical protein